MTESVQTLQKNNSILLFQWASLLCCLITLIVCQTLAGLKQNKLLHSDNLSNTIFLGNDIQPSHAHMNLHPEQLVKVW